MKKILTIMLVVTALMLLSIKTASAAASIQCNTLNWYLDDSRNTPGHYFLVTPITTAVRGQHVILAASTFNTGTVTLTNVRKWLVKTQTAVPWHEVDADTRCSVPNPSTPNKMLCKFGTLPIGNGTSGAERIAIGSAATIGAVLTGSSNDIGDYDTNLHVYSTCSPNVTLTIKS